MSKPAAIAGTFADFKVVKSRSTAQFVIEVALEQADAALEAMGGLPKPGNEVWVALARLVSTPDTGSSNGRTADLDSADAGSTPAPVTTPPAEKRQLSMASKAALFCQEKDARGRNLACLYFADRYPGSWEDTEGEHDAARADACLKLILGISSKRELDEDADFASGFETLRRDMNRWRNEEVTPA